MILAYLTLLGANVVYATSYVATRVTLGSVPPATLALARLVIGSLVLAPLARPRVSDPTLSGDDRRAIAWMGILGFAAAYVFGHWGIASSNVAWALDSARGRSLNDLEGIVWRVVSGLKQLDVKAEVRGTIKAPRLTVASNLDNAIAARLKAVIGEEVAKAEAMARAKVDSIVSEKVEPVKRQVAAVQAQATQRVAAEQQQLDKVQAELQAQLKRLTGGLAPGVTLPKIKL